MTTSPHDHISSSLHPSSYISSSLHPSSYISASLIQDAIEHSKKRIKGRPRWQSRTFFFISFIKAHAPKDTPVNTAFAQVDSALTALFPGSSDPWHTALDDAGDPRATFVDTWHKTKSDGWLLLESAKKKASSTPVIETFSVKYSLFLSTCYYLAQETQGRIFIPCRAWADVLGVDRKTIMVWRRLAVEQGFLIIANVQIVRRKATEFEIIWDAFEEDLAAK